MEFGIYVGLIILVYFTVRILTTLEEILYELKRRK